MPKVTQPVQRRDLGLSQGYSLSQVAGTRRWGLNVEVGLTALGQGRLGLAVGLLSLSSLSCSPAENDGGWGFPHLRSKSLKTPAPPICLLQRAEWPREVASPGPGTIRHSQRPILLRQEWAGQELQSLALESSLGAFCLPELVTSVQRYHLSKEMVCWAGVGVTEEGPKPGP